MIPTHCEAALIEWRRQLIASRLIFQEIAMASHHCDAKAVAVLEKERDLISVRLDEAENHFRRTLFEDWSSLADYSERLGMPAP